MKFPYAFSNFVWWKDGELRSELEKRIPHLPDEIGVFSPMEGRIHDALVELLRGKGVYGKVQSFDPSPDSGTKQLAPGAPPPAIVYTVAAPPEVLVDKLVLKNPVPGADDILREAARRMEQRPYNEREFWFQKDQIRLPLQDAGYLEAKVELQPEEPRREGDHYVVSVDAEVDYGTQYRILKMKVDGGPLIHGADLSQYFLRHEGDVASPQAFGRLPALLRSTYTHVGYMDVDARVDPLLDAEHAKVFYSLTVTPGEQYHLRSVTIKGVDAAAQETARQLLGMKPGDVYDEALVTGLYRKVATSDGELKGKSFSFSPTKDRAAKAIDLSLYF